MKMKVFHIHCVDGLNYALRYKGDKRLKCVTSSSFTLQHSLLLDSPAQIIVENFNFHDCDIILSSKAGITLRHCSFHNSHVRFDAADNVLVQNCRFHKTMVHSVLTQGLVLNQNAFVQSLVEFSACRNIHLQNSHLIECELVVCPNTTANIFNNALDRCVVILSPQTQVGLHECFLYCSRILEGDLLELYLCRNVEVTSDGIRQPLSYTSRNHDELHEPDVYKCRVLDMEEIVSL